MTDPVAVDAVDGVAVNDVRHGQGGIGRARAPRPNQP
jgi:hypothetical protein